MRVAGYALAIGPIGARFHMALSQARRCRETWHSATVASDSWGDLDAWTEANTQRNMAALGEEERPG